MSQAAPIPLDRAHQLAAAVMVLGRVLESAANIKAENDEIA